MSARIRGSKTDLEELGEEEDSFTKTTSKLRDLVYSLTGFDIMQDEDTYKDIYDIVMGIGKEWNNLTDIEQASLGEALAGKRNANAFYAVMGNLDTLQSAYESSVNSAGSAEKEQEHYSESIEFHVKKLQASLTQLANDFVSSDFLNYLTEVADVFVKIADTMTKIAGPMSIPLTIGGFDLIKGGLFNRGLFANMLQKDLRQGGYEVASNEDDFPFFQNLRTYVKARKNSKSSKDILGSAADASEIVESTNEIKNSAKETGDIASDALEKTSQATDGVVDGTQKVASNAMEAGASVAETTAATQAGAQANEASAAASAKKAAAEAEATANAQAGANAIKQQSQDSNNVAANASLGKSLLSTLAITGIITGITVIISMIQQAREKARQSVEDAADAIKTAGTDVTSYTEKYSELHDKLNSPNLTGTERLDTIQQELALQSEIQEKYGEQVSGIDLVNGKYEEQLALLKDITAETARNDINDPTTGKELLKDYQQITKDRKGNQQFKVTDSNIYSNFAAYVNSLNNGLSVGYVAKNPNNPSEGTTTAISFEGMSNQEIIDALTDLRDHVMEQETTAQTDEEKAQYEEIINAISSELEDQNAINAEYGEGYDTFIEELTRQISKGNDKNFGNDTVNDYVQYQKDLTTALESGDAEDIADARKNYEEVQNRIKEVEQLDSRTSEYFDKIKDDNLETQLKVYDLEEIFGKSADDLGTIQQDSNEFAGSATKLKQDFQTIQTSGITSNGIADMLSTVGTGKYYLDPTYQALMDIASIAGVSLLDENGDADVSKAQEFLNILEQVGVVADANAGDISDAYSDFISNTTDAITSIDTLNSAIAESNSGKGISVSYDEETGEFVSSIDTVIDHFEALELDTSNLLDTTANGITVNRKELEKLQADEERITLNNIIEQYNSLIQQRKNLLAEDPDANTDSLDSQIERVERLRDAYIGATSGYEQWQAAQQQGNARDVPQTVLSGYTSTLSQIENGWVGDEDVKAWLNLVFGQGNWEKAGANKTIENFKTKKNEYGHSVSDYFTLRDSDGNEITATKATKSELSSAELTATGIGTFFDDIVKAVNDSTKASKSDEGEYKLNMSDEDIQSASSKLGVSPEMMSQFISMAADAGFDVDMDYEGMKKFADESTEAAEQTDQIKENAEKIKEEGKLPSNFMQTKSLDKMDDKITTLYNKIKKGPDNGATTKQIQQYNKQIDNLVKKRTKQGTKNLSSQQVDELANASDQELREKLQIDDSQPQEVLSRYRQQLKEISNQKLHAEIDTKINESGGKTPQELVDELTGGNKEQFKIDLGINDSQVQEAFNYLKEHYKVTVDPEFNEESLKEQTVTGQMTITKVNVNPSLLNVSGGVVTYTVAKKSFDASKLNVDGRTVTYTHAYTTFKSDSLNRKANLYLTPKIVGNQVTLNVKKKVTTTSAGSGGKNKTSSGNKPSSANGTGVSGAVKSGKYLVNEEGPEIIVNRSKGTWGFANNGSPGFTTLNKGDIVFNARQTAELLKNGRTDKYGKSFASGTALKIDLDDLKKKTSAMDVQISINTYGNSTANGKVPKVKKKVSDNDKGTSSSDNGSSSKSKKSSSKKGSSGNGNSDKSSKNNSSTIMDWIEVLLNRIESAIQRWDTLATSEFKTLKQRDQYYKYELNGYKGKKGTYNQGNITQEINKALRAEQKYRQAASKYGGKISKSDRYKVQNGTMQVEKIKGDKRSERISNYQTYWEKFLSARQKVTELRLQKKQLEQDRKDLEEEYYASYAELFDKMIDNAKTMSENISGSAFKTYSSRMKELGEDQVNLLKKDMAEQNARADVYKQRMDTSKLNENIRKEIEAGTLTQEDYAKFSTQTQNAIKEYTEQYELYVEAREKEAQDEEDIAQLISDRKDMEDEIFDNMRDLAQKVAETQADIDDTLSGSAFKDYGTRLSKNIDKLNAFYREQNINNTDLARQQANMAGVGLNQTYIDQIKNGTIDIAQIQDKVTQDQVEDYQKYYEEMLDAQKNAADLSESIAQVFVDAFDLIADEYDKLADHINNDVDAFDTYESYEEAYGHSLTAKAYNHQKQNQIEEIGILRQELDALRQSEAEAIASGNVKIGTEAWLEFESQIDDVKDSILEANTAVKEIENNIRQLEWDQFDERMDDIDRVVDEASFVYDLFDQDTDFYKFMEVDGHQYSTGRWNQRGMAGFALLFDQYDVGKEKVIEYRKELEKLRNDFAKDPTNSDVKERLESVTDAYQSAVKAAKDERDAIIELVKDGYDKQIDALGTLIDEYNELLNQEQDDRNYADNIAEKSKEITNLQKQILVYTGDNSEEGRAKRQSKQNELEKSQKELEDTYEERRVTEIQNTLADIKDDMQATFNDRLLDIDNTIATTREMLSSDLNTNSDEVVSAVNEQMDKWNYIPLTDTITNNIAGESGARATVANIYSRQKDILDQIMKIQEYTNPDYQAEKEVADLINSIGNVGYDDASKQRIDKALSSYQALSEHQKQEFNNTYFAGVKDILDKAQNTYNAAKQKHDSETTRQAAIAQQQNSANAVQNAINAINGIGSFGVEDYWSYNDIMGRVNNARAQFNALTPEEQSQVTNSDNLTAAEVNAGELSRNYSAMQGIINQLNNLHNDGNHQKYADALSQIINNFNGLSQTQRRFLADSNTSMKTNKGRSAYEDILYKKNYIIQKHNDRQSKVDTLISRLNHGNVKKDYYNKKSNLWQYIYNHYNHAQANENTYKRLASIFGLSVGKDVSASDRGRILTYLKNYRSQLRFANISAFARGARKVDDPYAWTNEHGKSEMIVRKSDGAILTRMKPGDSVISAAASQNLWKMANNPMEFISKYVPNGPAEGATMIGNSNVSNEININLPNVSNYKEFVTELQKDPKFEQLIQEMTVGQLSGHGSLKKFNISM